MLSSEANTKTREIIETAGGEYSGIRGDSVRFRERETGESCSLYLFSCTPENVQLALKAARDRTRAAMWEFRA